MNYSVFRFTLNMHSHRSQASVSAFQGDTAIKLCITITDGGNIYKIENGCVAILSGTKSDGSKLWDRCVIERDTIIYDFNEKTTNCTGVVNCEITLYGGDGRIVTAPKFVIVVDEREVPGDANVPSDGDSNTAIDVVLNAAAQVPQIEERVRAIVAQSEAWANESESHASDAKQHAELALEEQTKASEYADEINQRIGSLDFSYNKDTGVLTFSYESDGETVTKSIDLPIESSIVELTEIKKGDKYYLHYKLASGYEGDIELDDIFKGLLELKNEVETRHKEIEYTPITIDGWYRIAQTKKMVYEYNNLVQLYANRNGRSNISIFATSGAFSTVPEITPIISTNYNQKPVEKIRIVYPKSYTGERAFLEVYVSGATEAKPITIKVSAIINTGWTFYTNEEMSLIETVPDTHNAEEQSIDNDIDLLMESNAKKLDAYTNKGKLNKVYVARKDGTQSTYNVTTGFDANTVMMRDNNGASMVQTPENPSKNYIANVGYVNKESKSLISEFVAKPHVWVDLHDIQTSWRRENIQLIRYDSVEPQIPAYILRPTNITNKGIQCELISQLPDSLERYVEEVDERHVITNIRRDSAYIEFGTPTMLYMNVDYTIYSYMDTVLRIVENAKYPFYDSSFQGNEGTLDWWLEGTITCLLGLDIYDNKEVKTYPLPLSVTDPIISNEYSAVNVRTMNKAISPLDQRLSFLEGGLLEYNENVVLDSDDYIIHAFFEGVITEEQRQDIESTGWAYKSPINEDNPFAKVLFRGSRAAPFIPAYFNIDGIVIKDIYGVNADGTKREKLFTLDDNIRQTIYNWVKTNYPTQDGYSGNGATIEMVFEDSFVDIKITNRFKEVNGQWIEDIDEDITTQIPYTVTPNLIFDCKDYAWLTFSYIDHVVEPTFYLSTLGFKKEN